LEWARGAANGGQIQGSGDQGGWLGLIRGRASAFRQPRHHRLHAVGSEMVAVEETPINDTEFGQKHGIAYRTSSA
jgi:hypothetical protein